MDIRRTLEDLVKGVKLSQSAEGKVIKFLRRIPMDPMTGTYDGACGARRTIR